jgi:hypothetical protein
LFTQIAGTSEAGDFFGSALATGDFNHDGFIDLAAGAPGEGIRTTSDAGAVSIIYGSASGLSGSHTQLFTQVAGTIEAGDEFGRSLASGDFNRDGFIDLAVGAPFEDVGTASDAGAVSILYGSASGITASGGQLFAQVAGTVEDYDEFGWALATGDFNSDGAADLAAGTPFESVGAIEEAGAVSIVYGSAGGLTATGGQLFTQVAGTIERRDDFGWALAAGDFNSDGAADLAAGAPGEGVGTIVEAGAVSVLRGSAHGLTATGGQLLTQDSPGVTGRAETRDGFGRTLAVNDQAGS